MKSWQWLQDRSLKWKALFIIIMLITLPIVTLGVVTSYQSNEILKQQVINETARNVSSTEVTLTAMLQGVKDLSTYMIFNEDFRTSTLTPQTDENQSIINQSNQQVSSYFHFQLMSNPYMDSVHIEGINGNVLEMGDSFSVDEQQWVAAAEEKNGRPIWSRPYPVQKIWMEEEQIISMFRVINDIHSTGDPIGLIRIRLKEREIYEIIHNALGDISTEAFILDREGRVISHEDMDLLGAVYPLPDVVERLGEGKQEIFEFVIEDERHFGVTHPIRQSDWHLVSMVPEAEIIAELSGIGEMTRNIWLISVVIGLFAVWGFYATIITPTLELTRQTKRVEHGDFGALVKVRSKDEIGQLGLRFNQMVLQIQRLINKRYKLEIKQKESEIKALQSQINPHFLYNTLDMIRWTARIEQAKESERLIEMFSNYFRVALSRGELWIPLRDELEHVKIYLDIQKKRLGSSFVYSVMMEASLENARVMKQILQPLAENSINHGFRDKLEDQSLTIRCYQEKQDVVMDVIDNGDGVDLVKMNAVFAEEPGIQSGYALKNINDRLKVVFGDAYGLTIMDYTQGAWIQVRVPALFSEQDVEGYIQTVQEGEDDQVTDRR